MNLSMFILKACELDPSFRREKSEEARKISMRRFLKKNNIVYRQVTHESQKLPSEVVARASDWMDSIQHQIDLQGRDPKYIINMDQTLVFSA